MLFLFLPLLLAFQSAAQSLEFITPGPFGTNGDFSLNPTYVFGSSLTIQWTAINESISLVLYQQLEGVDFEYIFQDKSDLTSFAWTVTTQRDLSKSRVFFFQIFIEGDTGPSASSHYFNITGGGSGGEGAVETTTSTSSSSASTSPATSSIIPPTTTTTSSSSSNTSSSAASSSVLASSASNDTGGLSTGAKVGLGIGIPLAVAIGVGVGWFLFGRRKRSSNTPSAPENLPYGHGYSQFMPQEHKDSARFPGELYAPPGSETHSQNPHQKFQVAPVELAHPSN
ncbi:hypothetical protein B0A52_04148 [Exophiala mesophila]|uniref:Mid2 domain-containing protein n=1 Tax=Exophiala mesophila TaxID=212818 RepID=A0A438NAG7_EXOME|nr:hypothetical protein B0A52_04148 [Exophiala mesophila]